jgi:hypothetical protein
MFFSVFFIAIYGGIKFGTEDHRAKPFPSKGLEPDQPFSFRTHQEPVPD